jgi:syntaxin 16
MAAKNVQRGLAAKVQDLSATFRKKQRVYMESGCFYFNHSAPGTQQNVKYAHACNFFVFFLALFAELQGHAIKNQDLLIASGTISLKGSEGMTAVDEDIEAAVGFLSSLSQPTHICFIFFPPFLTYNLYSQGAKLNH